MNCIYISPNYPDNHWNFCRRLRDNGVTVLGIGDCPYYDLIPELRGSLTEYYKVSSLENYEEVYRAVAYFIHRHGRIDFLESNNEYWLEQDARLRRDFNIATGFKPEDMPQVKCKSRMKDRYIQAGVPVALYHLVGDPEGCLDFIEKVGYPVIVKPDNGVGAINTFRIHNEDDLARFFDAKDDTQYLMEEYIDGTVVSYDAIVNSKGEILMEAGNLTPGSIMDLVNERKSCRVIIRNELPIPLRDMGRATLRAFDVRQRMVHFEFFQLNRDQRLGKKGDYVGLEVNMRPCGGILPSMINYAYSTDVYQIWADMLVFDTSKKTDGKHQFCALAGRRNERHYVMTLEEVRRAYAGHIVEENYLDAAMATDMGNFIFLATFPTMEEVEDFYSHVLAEV